MFGIPPSVVKPDYAKWMLDDPRVNFAVSTHGVGAGSRAPGLDHLGIQVEDRAELAEVYGRLRTADAPVLEQGATTCCYAESEKNWISDPQGIAWEAFLTTGESTVYGDGSLDTPRLHGATPAPCCGPAQAPAAACCAQQAEAVA